MSPLRTALCLGLGWAALAPCGRAQVIYGSAFTQLNDEASDLYTLNPTNGSATLIGPIGFERVSGIAFDRSTGTLYGVGRDGSDIQQLISINTTTGAGTAIG